MHWFVRRTYLPTLVKCILKSFVMQSSWLSYSQILHMYFKEAKYAISLHIFLIHLLHQCANTFYMELFHHPICHSVSRVQRAGKKKCSDIFPSLASPYETNSKKDCLSAFFSPSSLSLNIFSFFSLQLSLFPEVENLK